jgi:hypothetical protein
MSRSGQSVGIADLRLQNYFPGPEYKMSSTLRKFSQIPVRDKYLLAIADYDPVGTPVPSATSAFTLAPGAHINVTSIAMDLDVQDVGSYAPASVSATELYKDLGRQIVIFDANHNHVAVFRQVQLVSGVGTEGVCPLSDRCANIYVKVWSADGTGVVVARTG